MSRNKKEQPSRSEPTPEPVQSPYLGDLTPEFIIWHKESHTEEEHFQRYANRIPFEYLTTHNIEQV
jgi:hypothetical protein